jgi:hypothetical protein
VGWIPLGRRILWQKRKEDERRAREQLRPVTDNVKKITPATPATKAAE